MEGMKWPPTGSMGPIFGEFLYIQFFKVSVESKDEVFWPEDNFKQLATQIKQYVQPEKVPQGDLCFVLLNVVYDVAIKPMYCVYKLFDFCFIKVDIAQNYISYNNFSNA